MVSRRQHDSLRLLDPGWTRYCSNSREGGEPSFLLSSAKDERNGVYTPDGAKIVYASDESGIFNLYAYDLKQKDRYSSRMCSRGRVHAVRRREGDIAFACTHRQLTRSPSSRFGCASVSPPHIPWNGYPRRKPIARFARHRRAATVRLVPTKKLQRLDAPVVYGESV